MLIESQDVDLEFAFDGSTHERLYLVVGSVQI